MAKTVFAAWPMTGSSARAASAAVSIRVWPMTCKVAAVAMIMQIDMALDTTEPPQASSRSGP